jgi:HK97 family phage prohead protease
MTLITQILTQIQPSQQQTNYQKEKQLMNKPKNYHSSGFATAYNVKCLDGRTIKPSAFAHQDGTRVPLVWAHRHSEPGNILGHIILEEMGKGVYSYLFFNDTDAGKQASALVSHGDLDSLSIYANQLVEVDNIVKRGQIREVSLVIAGANPGAKIDNVLVHSDGSAEDEYDVLPDEAIIFSGLNLELAHSDSDLEHADSGLNEDSSIQDILATCTEEQLGAIGAVIAEAFGGPGTIKATLEESGNETTGDSTTLDDIFKTLNPLQLKAAHAAIGLAVEEAQNDTSAEHSNLEKDKQDMRKNIFDTDETEETPGLSHDAMKVIMADAVTMGSLKASMLKHAVTYGIDDIDVLFPDGYTDVNGKPVVLRRDTTWADMFISGSNHSPFSRIKSRSADLTVETIRARGYVTGALKVEEVFGLLKRVTTPTTVYIKQKFDRDDIVDITELDVVAWSKAEMRVSMNEELARAALLSDGRSIQSADKISETNIRPIYTDSVFYAPRVIIPEATVTLAMMDLIVRARSQYKGSGSPTFFTTSDILTDMLLLRDSIDHRLFNSVAEVAAALRCNSVVEVPLMEGIERNSGTELAPVMVGLVGIMVNPKDYTIGADRGGALSFFDDFDIDYNQLKFLMETRVSGALTLPASALIIEKELGD